MGKLGAVMHDASNSSHTTPRQLADRYAVTVPTVFNWFRAGIIPARIAVGRIYRFDLNEVEEALRRCSAGQETKTPTPRP
jgi:predicted site-specific integrase-resolvase